MTDELVCWKCGAGLGEQPLPLARLTECPACRADQHVCRLCSFYDTRVAKSCRETIAEEVRDKERANYCDYFQARMDAYTPPDDSEASRARSQLEDIFGGDAPAPADSADVARSQLDELFGKNKPDG